MRPNPCTFPAPRSKHASAAALESRKDSGLLFKASHCELQLKAELDESEPEGTISGYGSKFGLVDSYNETVKKGAFRASLADWKKRKKPIPMLWQHMGDQPIGAWTEFKEDDSGLFMKGQLVMSIPKAAEALALIKADIVTGLSIGYMELEADPWWDPEREGPRVLKKLDLRETSVVTFPALREAQLDAVKRRMAMGQRPTVREFEAFLRRELDFSRSEAAEIANSGYKGWNGRETGPEGDDDLTNLEKEVAQIAAYKPLRLTF